MVAWARVGVLMVGLVAIDLSAFRLKWDCLLVGKAYVAPIRL
jgi:hypothetical protein